MKRAASSEPSRFQVNRLKVLGFVAIFLLLSAIVPFTIQQELNGQFSGLWTRLASPSFLLIVLVLLIIYFLSDALRLWFTLRSLGHKLPFTAMIPLVFINLLFSNVTPMATGGGVAQVWFLNRRGVQVGAAVAATTLRTLMASMMIFVPASILLLNIEELTGRFSSNQWWASLGWFALLYTLFFIILLGRTRWFLFGVNAMLAAASRWHLIGQSRRQRWRLRLYREIIRFSYCFRLFLQGNPADSLLALLFTAVFLVVLFSFPALLLWTMDYPVDFPRVLALMVVNTFIMYFAPTPGAAGVAEGVFAVFFSRLVEGGDLFVLVVGWRFLTVHLGMLIGIPVSLYSLVRREPGNG